MRWILSAEDGDVSQVRLSINNGEAIALPVRLREGWSLRYEGGSTVTIHDARHRRDGGVTVDERWFQVAPGRHSITLDAQLTPADRAKARLELRPLGQAESIDLP